MGFYLPQLDYERGYDKSDAEGEVIDDRAGGQAESCSESVRESERATNSSRQTYESSLGVGASN